MLHEADPSTFPAEDFASIISKLEVDNCIVERCSKQAWKEAVENSSTSVVTEKYYEIDYALTPISSLLTCWSAEMSPLSSQLHLPVPNRYIPRSLTLHPSLPPEARAPRLDLPITPPVLLDDDSAAKGRLYFRQDDRYALPVSSLNLLLRNPYIQHDIGATSDEFEYSIEHEAITNLFSSVFSQVSWRPTLSTLFPLPTPPSFQSQSRSRS